MTELCQEKLITKEIEEAEVVENFELTIVCTSEV
jgi:hypothetical protein